MPWVGSKSTSRSSECVCDGVENSYRGCSEWAKDDAAIWNSDATAKRIISARSTSRNSSKKIGGWIENTHRCKRRDLRRHNDAPVGYSYASGPSSVSTSTTCIIGYGNLGIVGAQSIARPERVTERRDGRVIVADKNPLDYTRRGSPSGCTDRLNDNRIVLVSR